MNRKRFVFLKYWVEGAEKGAIKGDWDPEVKWFGPVTCLVGYTNKSRTQVFSHLKMLQTLEMLAGKKGRKSNFGSDSFIPENKILETNN